MYSEEYRRVIAQQMGLKEGAGMIGASESYLRRHTVGGREPRIPYRKIAGKIKVTVADLEAFIQSQPRSPDLPSDEELQLEIRNARAGIIDPEDQAFFDARIPRKG